MPFMSCGARLAIFAVFASAFFQKMVQQYFYSLFDRHFNCCITGLVLRKTVLPETCSTRMELPPYHLPRFTSYQDICGND